MQISGSNGPSFGSAMFITPAGGRVSAQKFVVPKTGRDPQGFLLELNDPRDALRRIERDDGAYRSRRVAGPASASSLSPLGLATAGTTATLTSTGQVNTTPTSWSPKEPDFGGSSSSTPTVTGVYDGSQGDDTLEFVVTEGGTVGGLFGNEIEVRDGSGVLVDTIDIGFGDADDVFTLSNGLSVSFSDGSLSLGDSFSIDVFATVGESLNGANAFDGSGDASANLDSGFAVVDGSFELNGAVIAVLASDSFDDVAAKIAASNAGVEMTYDGANDTVALTSTSAGESASIELTSDTSGLVEALELDGAAVQTASGADADRALDEVAAFAAVQSGTIRVAGVDIAIDTAVDSLNDVLARIESLVPGVDAAFDADSNTVTVSGPQGEPLEIDGNGTGFFAALGITDGAYAARTIRRGARFGDVNELMRSLGKFVAALDDVFKDQYAGFGEATVNTTRTRYRTVLASAFDKALGVTGDGNLRSGLGLEVEQAKGKVTGADLNRSKLEQAARSDPHELYLLLFAEGDRDGFDGIVTALASGIDDQIASFTRFIAPGGSGSLLDVSG